MSETAKNTTKRVLIHTDLDIIVARLRAREIARSMGFGTIDQARISLAAGELARVMANNMDEQGEILISGINTQGQLGIQVISVYPGGMPSATSSDNSVIADQWKDKALSDVMGLVDEGFVESSEDQGTRVTLMKWLS
jgi:serine/threonine-protein kinase RsbT